MLLPLVKKRTAGLFLLMLLVYVLCITVGAYVWRSMCVLTSGEWAETGNLVYRVIDFSHCAGSGWLLIFRDNDVTPDGAECLLIHDKVLGASSQHAGQIILSLCPPSSYHSFHLIFLYCECPL